MIVTRLDLDHRRFRHIPYLIREAVYISRFRRREKFAEESWKSRCRAVVKRLGNLEKKAYNVAEVRHQPAVSVRVTLTDQYRPEGNIILWCWVLVRTLHDLLGHLR